MLPDAGAGVPRVWWVGDSIFFDLGKAPGFHDQDRKRRFPSTIFAWPGAKVENLLERLAGGVGGADERLARGARGVEGLRRLAAAKGVHTPSAFVLSTGKNDFEFSLAKDIAERTLQVVDLLHAEYGKPVLLLALNTRPPQPGPDYDAEYRHRNAAIEINKRIADKVTGDRPWLRHVVLAPEQLQHSRKTARKCGPTSCT